MVSGVIACLIPCVSRTSFPAQKSPWLKVFPLTVSQMPWFPSQQRHGFPGGGVKKRAKEQHTTIYPFNEETLAIYHLSIYPFTDHLPFAHPIYPTQRACAILPFNHLPTMCHLPIYPFADHLPFTHLPIQRPCAICPFAHLLTIYHLPIWQRSKFSGRSREPTPGAPAVPATGAAEPARSAERRSAFNERVFTTGAP